MLSIMSIHDEPCHAVDASRLSREREDADGTAFGLLKPSHRRYGWYLIELRGVPFRATLSQRPHRELGWGGVWPRGIPVEPFSGNQDDEVGAKYLLRPAVNPADVYSVMILRASGSQRS